MKKTFSILKNKYFLFTTVMLVWLVFFDRYNIKRRVEDRMELKKLKEDRDFYRQKAEEARRSHDELFSNEESLEKFARERYYMKRDNEDVFIVEE